MNEIFYFIAIIIAIGFIWAIGENIWEFIKNILRAEALEKVFGMIFFIAFWWWAISQIENKYDINLTFAYIILGIIACLGIYFEFIKGE